jgi:hypothetical protein
MIQRSCRSSRNIQQKNLRNRPRLDSTYTQCVQSSASSARGTPRDTCHAVHHGAFATARRACAACASPSWWTPVGGTSTCIYPSLGRFHSLARSICVCVYIYRDLSIVICVALSIPHSLPRNSVYQDLYIHDICPAEPKWVVRHQRPLGATPQRRSFRPSIAPAIPLSRWAR